MRWIEIEIETTEDASDAVCEMLGQLGADGGASGMTSGAGSGVEPPTASPTGRSSRRPRLPIPLRPMTHIDKLDGGFAIVKANPRVVLALSAAIVLPAALPGYLAGIKQGWAFSWRSLMAGELLVVIPGAIALGNRLAFAQEFGDAAGLLAYMLVILVIGMLADTAFGALSRHIRRRRGLTVR